MRPYDADCEVLLSIAIANDAIVLATEAINSGRAQTANTIKVGQPGQTTFTADTTAKPATIHDRRPIQLPNNAIDQWSRWFGGITEKSNSFIGT